MKATTFSLVAVAFLANRAFAACAGIGFGAGVAQSPFDVCLKAGSPSLTYSTQYSCDGDEAFFFTYTSDDCSGTEASKVAVSTLGLDEYCSGDSCSYVVQRAYSNNLGQCNDDGGDYEYYADQAFFTGSCINLGNSSSVEGSCTSSSLTGIFYASDDCSGDVVNTTVTANTDCEEVIKCSSSSSAANFMLATVFLAVCASFAL